MTNSFNQLFTRNIIGLAKYIASFYEIEKLIVKIDIHDPKMKDYKICFLLDLMTRL